MPREVLPVELFNKGIIGSVNPGDIPETAASFSLDVDNSVEAGILQGRPDDEVVFALSPNEQNATISKLISEDDKTLTLIAFDKQTGIITTYQKFPEG